MDIEFITKIDTLLFILGFFIMSISLLIIIFNYNINFALNTLFLGVLVSSFTFKELSLIIELTKHD